MTSTGRISFNYEIKVAVNSSFSLNAKAEWVQFMRRGFLNMTSYHLVDQLRMAMWGFYND